MITYLYVKTHTITGLKYLGKTSKADPHKYLGSGKYWRQHLKKHGNHYTTEILKECQHPAMIEYWGLYYSDLWNIVDSDEWANLTPEVGAGGAFHGEKNGMYGKRHSEESIAKMKVKQRENALKRQPTIGEKNGHHGKKHSEEARAKMREYWARKRLTG